jgi:hypothetical protein
MSSNEADKKDTIREVLQSATFCRKDKRHEKRWFIEKLYDYFSRKDNAPRPKTQIMATINDVVALIKSKWEPPNPLLSTLGNNKRITKNVWRRKLIYGIFGVHPEVLEDPNSSRLDHLVARRIRILEKLKYFVNVDKDIFAYPSNGNMRVVLSAQKYWYKLNRFPGDDVFFLTSTASHPGSPQTGLEQPVKSVFSIFQPEPGLSREPNKLFCQQVATIVLMDSMIAGPNDGNLSVLAGTNLGYLRIGNPYGDIQNPEALYFSVDRVPVRTRFENVEIDVNDLQLGDHVHIRNHDLYSVLAPDDIWAGEHAFVTDRAFVSRGRRAKKAFHSHKYHGHGFDQGYSIFELFRSMIDYGDEQDPPESLNDHIREARKVVRAHWRADTEEDAHGHIIAKPTRTNGISTTLTYNTPGNIKKSAQREQELTDNRKYAAWYVEYVQRDSSSANYKKCFLFKRNGEPNIFKKRDIETVFSTRDEGIPLKNRCHVIRPKLP